MRSITVKAPEGQGKAVVGLALEEGVSHVSMHQAKEYFSDRNEETRDVVEVATATPKAKRKGKVSDDSYDEWTMLDKIRTAKARGSIRQPLVLNTSEELESNYLIK